MFQFEQLSEEEQWRVEHEKLHEKHRGHEQMHMEMFLILIVTLVVAQIALVQWKKRHFKSYQYYTESGLPKKVLEANVCAVCGNRLETDDTEADYEATYRLSCGHLFHEFCIRGWCVVGKQQTCPYCKEKAPRYFKYCFAAIGFDISLLINLDFRWERPHLFYGQLLDWIRYLVAWQPLIVTFVQGVNRFFGLE
ncbi:unnamed protein product [Gongylonema pulchrum]|uniref:RING-type domain-containing protein n=1 Tax=Gongylonema pulchrum TaxID=637853 RepID=A0A183DVD9_9BILA|nr:unnamed protein product [Gongylonema pulchrum]